MSSRAEHEHHPLCDLVALDSDHPGFRDATYRARRDAIVHIAGAYRSGERVPDAPYADEEHALWRTIRERLAPLHRARAAREVLDAERILPMDPWGIPQLSELNPRLQAATGFRLEPTAGLVNARAFLRQLGRRVFLSTQYIRHHSRPMYTPEPDVVHELVGHASMLAHPGVADANRRIGVAVERADDATIRRIERVYWYTMEFGVVDEGGVPKAFGAGLLSSFGELQRFDRTAELRPWNLDRVATTPYDPTTYQAQLYVAPSAQRLLEDVPAWVEATVSRAAGSAAPARST